MLPMSLSTITDAKNALNRLTEVRIRQVRFSSWVRADRGSCAQVLLAEEREDAFEIDASAKYAIRVENASFQWESSAPDAAPTSKKDTAKLAAKVKAEAKTAKKARKEREKAAKTDVKLAENGPTDPETAEFSGDATADVPDTGAIGRAAPSATPVEAEQEPMQLRNVNLQIPHGQLCAIVGSVGYVTALRRRPAHTQ